MLAEGFATSRGRRGTLIHHDAINHMLRGRRGARLTALTSGGTIPDNADYQVLLEPENQTIGTVNEDFAVESLAGDVFQLGNNAYRIMRVERGVVRVEDAHGQPPTIPFWLGEAPGRSDELVGVGIAPARRHRRPGCGVIASGASAQRWLTEEIGIAEPAAEQLLEYLMASFAALECLPTHDTHRAGALLRRSRRHAARHSFAVRQPDQPRLGPRAAQALLPQVQLRTSGGGDRGQHRAVADHHAQFRTCGGGAVSALRQRPIAAGPGGARCADVRHTLALGGGRRAGAAAIPRRQEGRRRSSRAWRRRIWSPACSPTRLACAENLVGDREIPDHPLTNQTIADCLHEAMDIEGLERLLARIESGDIRVVARDLTQPSPLALEVLSARPYAYLDDAPLEERRTQAVMARRWLAPENAADLGRLDPEAIARVRTEAWPDPVNAEELHDALLWLGCLNEDEVHAVPEWARLAGGVGATRTA